MISNKIQQSISHVKGWMGQVDPPKKETDLVVRYLLV